MPDSQHAFLFANSDDSLRAMTLDEAGSLLPETECWICLGPVALAVSLPSIIPPEPAIRGIHERGYYVWKNAPLLTFGTSQ